MSDGETMEKNTTTGKNTMISTKVTSNKTTRTTSTTSTMTTPTTAADQAWAILRRHARDEVSHLRLRELCRSDERVSALVSVHNATTASDRMMMVDLSRQFLTLETVNKLLYLSTARGIPKKIRHLAWGPYSSSRTAAAGAATAGAATATTGEGISSSTPSSPPSSSFPSYHLSLRAPAGKGMVMLDRDGKTNVLIDIHKDWDRIRTLSESLRRGQQSGVNGQMIRDVIVVGKGTAIMMLRFVYLALCKDMDATVSRRVGMNNTPQRRIKFLTTCDPIRAAAVVADSKPGATLVVTLSPTTSPINSSEIENTGSDEIGIASKTLQTWLISHLGQNGKVPVDSILKKHMMWVTTSASQQQQQPQLAPETVFLIPPHSQVEPFTSFTAASLLPLSIVFGWSIVEQMLAGAHDMDRHFVETNPRHNLPVLLGLIDVWNDSCFPDGTAEAGPILGRSRNNGNKYGGGAAGRIVSPFTEAFAAYPAFVAMLESQTCSRSTNTRPSASQTCSSVVIDGGLHGMYDRSAFQSTKVLPSELVMTLDSQLALNSDPNLGTKEVGHAQDTLMCSLFAHADELAFGSQSAGKALLSSPTENIPPVATSMASSHIQPKNSVEEEYTHHSCNDFDGRQDNNYRSAGSAGNGNRPSTLLLCDKLDAFACGQLVAMAEHRVLVKAWIWDIDPFVLDSGSSIRANRLNSLQSTLQRMIDAGPEYDGEDDTNEENGLDADLTLSTRTILRHYANMVSVQRTSQTN